MAFEWHSTPTEAEMESSYRLTYSLDPAFAVADRKWWESRTEEQLCHHARGGDYYEGMREIQCKARFYLARMAEAGQ